MCIRDRDSLDISGASENLSKCCEIIANEGKLERRFILNAHIEKLEKQLNAIKVLEKIHCSKEAIRDKSIIFNNIGYLIANLYHNAMRREKQEKYEMASLLLYRIPVSYTHLDVYKRQQERAIIIVMYLQRR